MKLILPQRDTFIGPDPDDAASDAAATAALAAHVAAADPHGGYLLDAAMTSHEGAADPHPGYLLESAIDWQDWSPTYVNLNIGSTGTEVARYVQIEKTVHFYWRVTLSGTGLAVSGDVSVTLPITAASAYGNPSPIGLAFFVETGVATVHGSCHLTAASATSMILRYWNTATAPNVRNALLGAGLPHTWGSTDVLSASGTYEAA